MRETQTDPDLSCAESTGTRLRAVECNDLNQNGLQKMRAFWTYHCHGAGTDVGHILAQCSHQSTIVRDEILTVPRQTDDQLHADVVSS